MRNTTLSFVGWGILAACGFLCVHGCGNNKVAFTGVEKVTQKKETIDFQAKDNVVNSDISKKSTPQPEPSAKPTEPPKETPNQPGEKFVEAKETFDIAATDPPPSDFVFVVDSSGSMAPLINKFTTGFERISNDKYPPGSRIAVMNMIASDPSDLSKPLVDSIYAKEPLITQTFLQKLQNLVRAEPGYLRFINKIGIENFRTVVSTSNLSSGAQWNNIQWRDMLKTHDGCDDSWFEPGARNSDGISCLRAAMQITGVVGVESGLLAILQLMQKNSMTPLFRENGTVHFVLISDTHDPGHTDFFNEDYRKIRPKFDQINTAVRNNSSTIKQVKIHGVIPKLNTCTRDESDVPETSYLPEINASGGVWVDACDSDLNYETVVNQIFNEAKKAPAFVLKSSSVKDVSVKVNNQNWDNFKIIGGNSVEVAGLSSMTAYKIEITYSKAEK